MPAKLTKKQSNTTAPHSSFVLLAVGKELLGALPLPTDLECGLRIYTTIVTGRTRREASGSICKAFIQGRGLKTSKVHAMANRYNTGKTRVVLGQVWVYDRRTISNRQGREIIQVHEQ